MVLKAGRTTFIVCFYYLAHFELNGDLEKSNLDFGLTFDSKVDTHPTFKVNIRLSRYEITNVWIFFYICIFGMLFFKCNQMVEDFPISKVEKMHFMIYLIEYGII